VSEPTSTSNKADSANPAETPILTLLAEIKSKQTSPVTITAENRRQCVDVLRCEGYSIAEIAQILARNEKTIRRDIQQIRDERALAPDPRLPERLIGQLSHEAEVTIARLRRIARDPNCSGMERLMAESMAWKTIRELFEKLQSVGYLPKVPATYVAELYQKFEPEPVAAYEQLSRELQELVNVAQSTGQHTLEQADRYLALRDEVERGRLSVQMEKLKDDISKLKEK